MMLFVTAIIKALYLVGIALSAYAYAAAHPDAYNAPDRQAWSAIFLAIFWPVVLVIAFFEGVPAADYLIAKIEKATGVQL